MNAPDFEQMRKQLPDMGDGLATACVKLHDHPSAEQADALASVLLGGYRHALGLAETIRREVANG